MKKIALLAIFALSLTSQAADVARGEKLYKKCMACHGKDGMGVKAQNAPRLAGQYDWYIVTSLQKFKKKERVNKVMDPFIRNLNDQDFQDLGAYLYQLGK